MKLAISNIAWESEKDQEVYALMNKYGFIGLEIAPTRIFPTAPYEDLSSKKEWSVELHKEYGFSIPSMQSIWFGKQEKIFGNEEERQLLLEYTKRAIDFAKSVKCSNLVFGCPRNRNVPDGIEAQKIAVPFFYELGEYALAKGTVIGMEANPPIYNTNYVNDTISAIELIKQIHSEGFKLNLDVGTMIQNSEKVSELKGNVSLINHVHISEPGLKIIQKRELHQELAHCLREEGYSGFISIEMGKQENVTVIEETMAYIKEIFG